MLSEQEQLKSVSSEEWLETYMRLRLHTWKRYGWLRTKVGLDPDDLIHQAISDTLQGTRRWPPVDSTGQTKENVSLFFFLCQVVRSNVSHILEQEGRKVLTGLIVSDQEALVYDAEHFQRESFETLLAESLRIHPGRIPIKGSDSDAIDEEFTRKLRGLVSGDHELTRIVGLILEDSSLKPKEIAERLGLSLRSMYSALKRLRRKLRRLKGIE